MSLMARKAGNNIDPIPEGTHNAICYLVCDVGTHFNAVFGKSAHQVIVSWEFPGVRAEFERDGVMKDLPRVTSNTYTLSLHEKANLRRHLESWRGKTFTDKELEDGFDLKKLLGVPAQVQILHNHKNDKTYANITAILPFVGERPETENPHQYHSFETGETENWESIPDWIKDKINKADENKDMGQSDPGDDYDDDQIPF